MDAVVWILAALAACALGAGWQAYRYPGGWAFAFGPLYRDERRQLAQARATVRALDRRADRTVGEARSQLESERTRHGTGVRTAERRVSELRNPGAGELIDSLAEFTLYKHVLRVEGRQYPLHRLEFSSVTSSAAHHVVVRPYRGSNIRRPLSVELHDEDAVLTFVLAVENAVKREREYQAGVKKRIADAEQELERARGATVEVDVAQARLDRVTAEQRDDPERALARRQLEAALDAWAELSGRRPR